MNLGTFLTEDNFVLFCKISCFWVCIKVYFVGCLMGFFNFVMVHGFCIVTDSILKMSCFSTVFASRVIVFNFFIGFEELDAVFGCLEVIDIYKVFGLL